MNTQHVPAHMVQCLVDLPSAKRCERVWQYLQARGFDVPLPATAPDSLQQLVKRFESGTDLAELLLELATYVARAIAVGELRPRT